MENNNTTRGRRSRRRKRRKKSHKLLYFVIAFLILAIGVATAYFGFFAIHNVATSSDMVSEEITEATTIEETTIEGIPEEALNEADEILNSMSIDEKINQMFFITPESLTGVGTATAAGNMTKTALEERPVGGIIYFSQNIQGEEQFKTMIANTKEYAKTACKVPLFIGIDEEGGTVARLGNSQAVNVEKVENMSAIGASGDSNNAYEAGNTIGKYLSEYGFNVDFAPDADVLTNSNNRVVKDRSFGSDPQTVVEMTREYSKGLKANNILNCYKHFPGHGATTEDSHEGLAYIEKTYNELMESELLPFVDAVQNNADFIMVGHISLPAITGDNTPASLSPKVINDILIEDMGYKGIVITDSLAMGAIVDNYGAGNAAVMTIKAGSDMLLMPQDYNEAFNSVKNAVENGEISEERIDNSVRKIIAKKISMNLE